MDASGAGAGERTVVLAAPRGFCAGVAHAIEILDLVLARYGAPVYVRHEIVHNRHVVEDFRARGVRFVDDLGAVPAGSVLVFSAHGVSPAVRAEAERRALRAIDATCPLVTKVHVETLRHAQDGCDILLVGHRGHVEVEGTVGHAPDRIHVVETAAEVAAVRVRDPERVAVVTQTTLSVDDTRAVVEAILQRFPQARTPRRDDICYATQNRQNAVKALAARCALVLVLGSRTSSNATRLVEVARAAGARAELVDAAAEIDPAWLAGVRAVGVTAGASTPEPVVAAAVDALRRLGFTRCETLVTAEERVTFALPRALRAGA